MGQDDYDIVDEQQPAKKTSAPKTRVVMGVPVPLSPTRGRQAVEEGEDEEPTWKWAVVPPLMIVAGFFWTFHSAEILNPEKSAAVLLGVIACQSVLTVAMMLLGAWIAAGVLSVTFGSVGRTLLKLTGMALTAMAVGAFIFTFDRHHRVGIEVFAVHSIFLTYCIFFALLFDLDLQEVIMTTVIIGLIHSIGACAMWQM